MTTRNERDRREGRKTSAADWANQPMSNFEATSVQLPEGVTFFTMKKPGTYEIDVVPYWTGEGNPKADADYEHFERTFYVHRNMGLEGKSSYVCGASFREPCPICAWINRSGGVADPDLVKRIKQQLRQLWCVIDLKSKDQKVQVFDAPFWKSFGEILKNKIKARSKYATFADLTGGYTLILSVEESSIGTNKFNAVVNIEMEPRGDYPKDVRDNAPCLDNLLIRRTPEELQKLLDVTIHGGDTEESRKSEGEPEARTRPNGPGTPPSESTGRNRMRLPEAEDNGHSNGKDEEKPTRRESREREDRPDARGNSTSHDFKVGDFVMWDTIRWEVTRTNRDGSLDLEDDNGDKESGVPAADVQLVKTRNDSRPGVSAVPAKKTEDEPGQDDEPPRRRGRPVRS